MSKVQTYAVIGVVGVVAVVVLYKFFKAEIKEIAQGVGGAVSGNNDLTRGTAYEGAGIAGTLGAGANSASGGGLASIGESIGGWFFDVLHPNAGGLTRPQELVGSGNTLPQNIGDNFYNRGVLQ